MKKSIKVLNDQRVKNECLIRGVEAKDDSNAVETILSLTKTVGLEINENNIEDAYFFKTKGERNQVKKTMVVKFSNKRSKEMLMMSKTKLKEHNETKNIYVNDYLSKETLGLFNHARSLKAIGFHSIYTNGARVYVKKTEKSKPMLIKDEDDVDNIMAVSATTGTRQRRISVNIAEESEEDENGPSFASN